MNKWNFGQTLVFLLLLSVSPASFAATLDFNAEAALHTDIELNGKTSIIVEYNSTAALIKMNGASRKALAQSLHQNFINHSWRCRDQIHIIFSFQALLHNVHMQQTKKTTAKTKP